MRRVPRAGCHEVGQGLPVTVLAQAGGHRLHRLAPAVQQQAPQTDPTSPPLIRPRERLEHLRRESEFGQDRELEALKGVHPVRRRPPQRAAPSAAATGPALRSGRPVQPAAGGPTQPSPAATMAFREVHPESRRPIVSAFLQRSPVRPVREPRRAAAKVLCTARAGPRWRAGRGRPGRGPCAG